MSLLSPAEAEIAAQMSRIADFNDTQRNQTWHMPLWGVTCLWLTTVLISLQTIAGNLLVLLAFGTDKNLRVTSNFLIVSLAVSDLIIGIEGFPVLTHYVTRNQVWDLGEFACKLWIAIDYTLCLVSIITVLLITIDRFLSVCYTAVYRNWQTDNKMFMFIVFSWTFPFTFFMGSIYGYYHDSRSFADDTCYAPFLDDPYLNMAMYIVYYWATLAAMVVLYRGIHRVAREVQERAEAKEKQAIAMAALQRCMAQMGVSMLLASERKPNQTPPAANHHRPSGGVPNVSVVPDSGYSTATAVCTYQPAPIVIENHVIPSIVSESDSAALQSEQSDSFASASADLTFEPAPIVPARSVSPSSSSYTSFASLINYEGYGDSFVDEDIFASARFIHPKIEQLSHETFRTVSSVETYVTAEDFTTSPSVSSIGRSDSGHLRRGASHPTLASQSSLPAKWPSRHASVNSALRWSLRTRRQTCHTIKEEASSKEETDIKESVHKELSALAQPEIGVDAASFGNVTDSTETSQDSDPPTRASSSPMPSFPPSTGRKDNVITATIRRISEISNANGTNIRVAHYRTSSASSSKESSSAGKAAVLNPIIHQQSTTDMNDLTSAIASKASKIFEGGQDFISNLFTTSWLKGRRRKKTRAERRARKAFRTITIILGAFVLFWSPYYILATIYGFCRLCVPQWLYVVSYYMCYLNSTINPFCYALANRQFKIAFGKILSGELTKKRNRAYSLRSANRTLPLPVQRTAL